MREPLSRRRPGFPIGVMCLLLLAGSGGGVSAGAQDGNNAHPRTLRVSVQRDPEQTDPALAYDLNSWQIDYATCLLLLNYRSARHVPPAEPVPEAAAAMPAVSPDGRTYTFRIREGFRFSPPSDAEVTAASFRRAIERVLDPGMHSPGAGLVRDVVGADAFQRGKTSAPEGVRASGQKLSITLRHAAPDFLARLASPYFCAVPPDTPSDPRGVDTIAMAGPYYVASRTRGRSIVIKRNPNYGGHRHPHLDAIVYTAGTAPAQILLQIEKGEQDYGEIPPTAHAALSDRWGPGSENARNGKQRYFVTPSLTLYFFALNTSRPLFADPVVRKAVNLALDRPALVRQHGAFAGRPTDQILPHGLRGFRDAQIYPLEGPDLARARKLMGGRRGKAVLYTCNTSPCTETAQIFERDLAAIGITVEIRPFDFLVAAEKAGIRGEPFDAVWVAWGADYADPSAFLNRLFDGGTIAATHNLNYSYFDDPGFNRKVRAAAALDGPARYRRYGDLDVELSRAAAPIAPYMNGTYRDFFSRRVGCQSFTSVYGVDLAALCIER